MAFVRDYAMASGDPFRFRLPSFRKIGRGLARAGKFVARHVARPALGLIPGVGSALEMARGYGFEAGDALPRGAQLRGKGKAAAAAGHKHVGAAAHHAAKAHQAHARGDHAAAAHHASKAHGHGLLAHALGAGAHAVASGLPDMLSGLKSGGPLGAGLAMLQHGSGSLPDIGGAPGAGGFGRRRRVNPTNVKALKRSIRRIEGFEKLVRNVERAFPRLKAAHRQHSHSKGHKPGCGCVACKHRR